MKRKTVNMLEEGDKVVHTGDYSYCSTKQTTVTRVVQGYDKHSGKPYPIIYIGEWKFDGRTGNAINPPLAYYIVPVQ